MAIVFDILIILLILAGAVILRASGFIKNVISFVLVYVASIIASLLSNVIFNLLYKDLPFMNLIGKAEGIKIINVFFWRSVFFFLIFAIIVIVVRKIFSVLKIDEKLDNSLILTGIINDILGFVVALGIMAVVTFDAAIMLLFPMFSLSPLAKSTVQKSIVKNMPILYSINGNFYENEIYTIDRLNKSSRDSAKKINKDIVKNMLKTGFLTDEIIDELEDRDKLIGNRSKNNVNSSSEEEYDENEIDEDEVDDKLDED